MTDLTFMISIIFPAIFQYFLFNIYGKKGIFYKLPKNIIDKVKSNPKDLDKFDREVLFDVLQVNHISNEAINFISKNSENPLKNICIFSKIEKKYLTFDEGNVYIHNKYIINRNVDLSKKIFKFIYYIFAFISLYLLLYNFFRL